MPLKEKCVQPNARRKSSSGIAATPHVVAASAHKRHLRQQGLRHACPRVPAPASRTGSCVKPRPLFWTGNIGSHGRPEVCCSSTWHASRMQQPCLYSRLVAPQVPSIGLGVAGIVAVVVICVCGRAGSRQVSPAAGAPREAASTFTRSVLTCIVAHVEHQVRPRVNQALHSLRGVGGLPQVAHHADPASERIATEAVWQHISRLGGVRVSRPALGSRCTRGSMPIHPHLTG